MLAFYWEAFSKVTQLILTVAKSLPPKSPYEWALDGKMICNLKNNYMSARYLYVYDYSKFTVFKDLLNTTKIEIVPSKSLRRNQQKTHADPRMGYELEECKCATLCSVSDSMLCDNYNGNNMDDISVNTWLEEFLNLLNGLIVQTDQANHFLMSSLWKYSEHIDRCSETLE